MKFTFDYRGKVRFFHDLAGSDAKLDKKFDEMLDFNADKVVANGTGDLNINVMDFVRSLYGAQFGQYIDNGIEVNYQFEYGTVHFWGNIYFNIVDEHGCYNDDVTDEFKEYLTAKLCDVSDLNLDLDALCKKWSYLGHGGRVHVGLVKDSARCEVSIEQD